jgi:hypothetical protein
MILTQCVYLSTLIRNIEIGHNLNLAHSGEAATYDDQSGMVSTFQLPFWIEINFKTMTTTKFYQSTIDGIQLQCK